MLGCIAHAVGNLSHHIMEVMCQLEWFRQSPMSWIPACLLQEVPQTTETNVCIFVCQIMKRAKLNMFSVCVITDGVCWTQFTPKGNCHLLQAMDGIYLLFGSLVWLKLCFTDNNTALYYVYLVRWFKYFGRIWAVYSKLKVDVRKRGMSIGWSRWSQANKGAHRKRSVSSNSSTIRNVSHCEAIKNWGGTLGFGHFIASLTQMDSNQISGTWKMNFKK